jgi:TetR/AcrR family transcriptional regulator
VPKEERSSGTRNRILEVAETQFAVKGYSGAHLQSLAEEVGVQKTALYYYFPSKRALYVAVLERMLETFDNVISAATSRGTPSAETLGLLLDDLNEVLAQHPNYSQILIRIFVDRIEIDASAITPILERIINPLLQFYAAGVERSAFRKLSSRHVVLTVLGASIFHYAAGDNSSDILGVDDVFSPEAVEWRRREVRRLLMQGILPGSEPDQATPTPPPIARRGKPRRQ